MLSLLCRLRCFFSRFSLLFLIAGWKWVTIYLILRVGLHVEHTRVHMHTHADIHCMRRGLVITHANHVNHPSSLWKHAAVDVFPAADFTDGRVLAVQVALVWRRRVPMPCPHHAPAAVPLVPFARSTAPLRIRCGKNIYVVLCNRSVGKQLSTRRLLMHQNVINIEARISNPLTSY